MSEDKDTDQIPDAYDADGRPLFYHPPQEQAVAPEVSTPPTDNEVAVTDQPNASVIKMKHDRSV
ncbi:hypothetical protein FWF48_03535, partial [Candidatus Saccharibacteria bacterium]|nr:hypothetical protein [Candidatus Saccharibacteria bacterium]